MRRLRLLFTGRRAIRALEKIAQELAEQNRLKREEMGLPPIFVVDDEESDGEIMYATDQTTYEHEEQLRNDVARGKKVDPLGI